MAIMIFTPVSNFGDQSLDQLTLFKPWGSDYARHTTASPPPRIQNAIYTSENEETYRIQQKARILKKQSFWVTVYGKAKESNVPKKGSRHCRRQRQPR